MLSVVRMRGNTLSDSVKGDTDDQTDDPKAVHN